jgi:hypothetical protein
VYRVGTHGGREMANGELVRMSAGELAELLGLPREDGRLFSGGEVSVPGDFIEKWRTLVGPRELTLGEACMVTGWKRDTVYRWHKKRLLVCRAAVQHRDSLRVAPAELARRLRVIQDGAGCNPAVSESDATRADRARRAKERARAAIRGRG